MSWTLWCTIHSAMISLTVNTYFKHKLGGYYKFYRLFYNLVASATFIPLVLYSRWLKGPVLFRWEGHMIIVQIALLIIVISLFVSGALKYDMLQFVGFRQIKSGRSHSALSKGGQIDTSGILSITRHPWYLAAIILVWIAYREMYVSTLIVNVILTIYLVIGTFLEERKLIIELGDNYRDYKNRVSMLLPTKWMFSKSSKDSGTTPANRWKRCVIFQFELEFTILTTILDPVWSSHRFLLLCLKFRDFALNENSGLWMDRQFNYISVNIRS